MNKLLLIAMACAPVFAQDPRGIITEVQKRSYSKSQRYEGTLEVIGNGSRIQNHYFNGTLINGKLLATAPRNGLRTWTLEGQPAKH